MRLLIVGEQRSNRALAMGVQWEDEALAAIPLFQALRATGIEPTTHCRFVNWFEGIGRFAVQSYASLGDTLIVGLGKKVQKAMTGDGIEHVPLIHPAARGRIRLRANYIAHVNQQLFGYAPLLSPW